MASQVADHDGIHVTLNIEVPKPALPSGTFLQYSKADTDGLWNELSSTDWHKIIDGKNINDAWCAFRDYFLARVHKYVPQRKAKPKKKPWITMDTINLARRKYVGYTWLIVRLPTI